MSLLSLVLLGCVLFFILTAVVGGVLDLPSLSTFRATLAERHIKPWAVVVALSPPITAALDLPARVATLGKLPIGPTTAFSLIGGMFFTAALAGCWLAMDEEKDPHTRPKRALVIAYIVLGLNAIILHWMGKY